ncbi:unnamed protein product [Rhizophagus irregularis]|uniref:Uncharacterized protein n=1 Tax=Rhizophagus irregularis TaxID=588596 RepID=A0A916EI99_9GLOM|nr:unnamed protein product [Rhizophagus irregularis]CAB5177834.1 unnamed protein product [Rhizophagus irregularis]CAB5393373.1 unnamed protein product [Rhizophagus irregularis]
MSDTVSNYTIYLTVDYVRISCCYIYKVKMVLSASGQRLSKLPGLILSIFERQVITENFVGQIWTNLEE